MALSQAVARPVRTTAQASVALIIVNFVQAWGLNMDDQQFGASVAVLTIVVGLVQNLVENYAGKGLFRSPDEADQPVVAG